MPLMPAMDLDDLNVNCMNLNEAASEPKLLCKKTQVVNNIQCFSLIFGARYYAKSSLNILHKFIILNKDFPAAP